MSQDRTEVVDASLNSEELRVKKLHAIFELLKQSTSISVIRDFLKDKNLKHSAGSWDDLLQKRIIPEYENGNISINDLDSLLNRTEGYGRQHIFLFKCKEPSHLNVFLSEGHIENGLKEITKTLLNAEPIYVEFPEKPTIVDARLIDSSPLNLEKVLVIKEIEKKISHVLAASSLTNNGQEFIKRYSVKIHRAINVMRLWGDGVLEIRIASKDNSVKYKTELSMFFQRISSILQHKSFEPIKIDDLKKNLWDKRFSLSNLIRFSTYKLRDDEGISLQANVELSVDDLAGSSKVAKSLDEFDSPTTFCTDSSIFFKYPTIDGEYKEIHVLLSGESNEFAITAAISEEEYDYVLGKILEHN